MGIKPSEKINIAFMLSWAVLMFAQVLVLVHLNRDDTFIVLPACVCVLATFEAIRRLRRAKKTGS